MDNAFSLAMKSLVLLGYSARTIMSLAQDFWALKYVSFEIVLKLRGG